MVRRKKPDPDAYLFRLGATLVFLLFIGLLWAWVSPDTLLDFLKTALGILAIL